MIISLHPSQVLCCICLQQKFFCEISFYYNSDGIDASLKHGFHGRLPCDHQTELMTFALALTLRRHLYEIRRPQRKQITLFDWLLVPQLILTEDQIILLDLVTPSRNSVLCSPRTRCILKFLCTSVHFCVS